MRPCCRLLSAIVPLIPFALVAAEPGNLVVNGGFESGLAGWMYHQWEGRPPPGRLDADDRYDGLASFKLSTPGETRGRYLAREVAVAEPALDHVLTFALKPSDLPPGACRVRLAIDGHGWFAAAGGTPDLIQTGGTRDWRVYGFAVPAARLRGARKVTIFFYHDEPGKGTLGIDAVAFGPGSAKGLPPPPAQPTLSVETTRPATSTFPAGERVGLLFSAEGLAGEDAPVWLDCAVLDEFGGTLASQRLDVVSDAGGRWTSNLAAPSDRLGFYRVKACLSTGARPPARGSRAAGFVTYAVVPDPAGRRDFGEDDTRFGMQGGFGPWRDEVLAHLGARWVLDGELDWRKREPDRSGQFKAADAKPVAAPPRWRTYALPTLFMAPAWAVVPETHAYNTGTLTPAGETAWAAYCREAATAFAVRHPDRRRRIYQITWEPIQPWGFKGRDEDLVRIYEIAHGALHAADPRAVVAGPCRGIDKNEVERTTALLRLGLGKWIDAYSVHPYFSESPERDGMARRLRDMASALQQHTGRRLPMYGTEQGLSTHEDPGKDLAHARALIRQNLITLGEGYAFNMAFYVVDYRMAGQSGYGYYYNLEEGVPWGPRQIAPRPVAPAFAAQSLLLDGHDSEGPLTGFGETVCGYVFRREADVVLAVWDYGREPGAVIDLPVGAARVQVHDWMGNASDAAAPRGRLRIALGPEPVYVTGVSPRLWGAQAERLLSVTPTRPVVTDGASATLQAAVEAPAARPVEGVLTLEADDRLGLPPQQRPVAVPAGTTQRFIFDLPVPANAPAAVLPLRLTLLESDVLCAYAGAELELSPPVVVGDAAPVGPGLLSATVRNRGARRQSGRIEMRLQRVHRESGRSDLPMIDLPEGPLRVEDVAGSERQTGFDIAAGGEQRIQIDVAGLGLSPLDGYRLQSLVTPREGRSSAANQAVSLATLPRARAPITADGRFDDWQDVPAASVAGGAVMRSPQHHSGDGDLSARLRLAWNEKGFWLAAEVTDDAWVQRETGVMIWRGDCVQVAVDTAAGADVPSRNTETAVALTERGAEAYRHLSFDPDKLPMGPLAGGIACAVRKTDDGLAYEIGLPWASLGLEGAPAAGRAIGLAVCINDSDRADQGDPSALGVFDGIAPTKDPGRFGRFVLTE